MPRSKSVSGKVWAAVAAVFVLLGLLSWRPEWIILVAPGVRVSSAYCSRWKAAADERIFLKQVERARRIKESSQLVRTEEGLDLWRTPMGDYWIPAGSGDVLHTLLAQQERKIYGEIRRGEVIIDCGAHVGTFARAALAQGAAKVIAVEPAPEALSCLRRNLEREIADGRVIVIPKGIWDENGELTFYLNGNGDAADSFVTKDPTSKKTIVPVTTIDTIAAELKLESVTLVKADVKGAASRALAGGAATIRRFHPRLAIATEEPPEDPAALSALVQGTYSGYRAVSGPCLVIENEIRTDVMFYE